MISLIQTAEGALNETHAILQRMRELAVQSSNDTNTKDDRDELQKEVNQLVNALDDISKDTEFNTKKLLNGNFGGSVQQDASTSTVLGQTGVASASTTGAKAGTYTITASTGELTMTFDGKTQTISNSDGAQKLNFSEFGISIETNAGYTADAGTGDVVVAGGSATFQIGANGGQNLDLSIGDMSAKGLLVDGIDISSTQSDADAAIGTIQNAIDLVSAERSKLGATQNRLDHTINNLGASAENLTAAESRIRDVDYDLVAA